MPKRIQMSRQTPWRADNPDAIRVDRTSKYGNPFRVIRGDCSLGGLCWKVAGPEGLITDHHESKRSATEHAVQLFANWISNTLDESGRFVSGAITYHGAPALLRPTVAQIREDLGGHDLACWCALDMPCHCDVLLRIANPTPQCPECAQGKVGNCIGWTLDEDDNEVPCNGGPSDHV